ncbi:MAG: methyl-accepting chemotaxis protein [Candidatus Methylacidiphilales bacterium]|nr:methyl-accepting chemotaxis protein [Candidatus Methylacidiphilales bacterium]
MTSLPIKWRVAVGFIIVVAIAASVMLFALVQLTSISRESNEVIMKILPPLTLINDVKFNVGKNFELFLQEINIGEKNVELAKEDADEKRRIHDTISKNTVQISQDLEKFRSYMETDSERLSLGKAIAAGEQYEKLRAEIDQLSDARKVTEALAMFNAKLIPTYESYLQTISELVDTQRHQAEEMGQEIKNDVYKTIVVVCGGLLVSIASSWWIAASTAKAIAAPLQTLVTAMDKIRTGDFTQGVQLPANNEFGRVGEGINAMVRDLGRLVSQVQRSGIQVKTSVTEISATAKEHQATATEIATTTSEITATAREISRTSQTLRTAADRVAKVSDEAAGLASDGQKGLTRMDSSMKQIMEASSNITSKLVVINEKAGSINTVVGTINKLAEQTNLLSLNAAIEAERAGEFGQGFSVVATEIRRLADQTAEATYDIEQIIKEMVAAVSAGVMSMDKFGEEVRRGAGEVETIGGQLEMVIHQVRSLVPEIKGLNEGVHSQASSSVEITEALTQLGEAAAQTSESLRQANSAIEQLNEAARGLYGGISRFKVRSSPGSDIEDRHALSTGQGSLHDEPNYA